MSDKPAPDKPAPDKPAPDKTVYVTFTPPGHWEFSERVTRMHAPGTLFLEPSAKPVAWTFVAATVMDDDEQFCVEVEADCVAIHNRHLTFGTFPYTVTVQQDGHQYPSARRDPGVDRPPQIENQPSLDGEIRRAPRAA